MAFNIVQIVKNLYFELTTRRNNGDFASFPPLERAVDGIDQQVISDKEEASKSAKDLSNVEDRLAQTIVNTLKDEQKTIIEIANSITTKENLEKITNGTFTAKDAFNSLNAGQIVGLAKIAVKNLGTIFSIFFNGFHKNATFVNKIAGSKEVGDFTESFLKGTNIELDKRIFEAINPKITAPDKAITFAEKPVEYVSEFLDAPLSQFVKNNDTAIREVIALKDLDVVELKIKEHSELKKLTKEDWKKIRAAYAIEKKNKFMLDKLYSVNPQPSKEELEALKKIIIDSKVAGNLRDYLSDISEPLYQYIISDKYAEEGLDKMIEAQYTAEKRVLFKDVIEKEKTKYKETAKFLREKIGINNIPKLQALYAAEYEYLKAEQQKEQISNDDKQKISNAVKGLHELFIEGKFDLDEFQKDNIGYALKALKGADLKKYPELPSTLLKLLYNSSPQARKQLEDMGLGQDVLKLADLLVTSPKATVIFIEAFIKYNKGKKNDPTSTQDLVVAAIGLISDISKNKGFENEANKKIVSGLLEMALLPALGGKKSNAIVEFIVGNLKDATKLQSLKNALEDPSFTALLLANQNMTKEEDKILLIVTALDFLSTDGMQEVLKNSYGFDKVLEEFLVVIPDSIRPKVLDLIKSNYTNPQMLQHLKYTLGDKKFLTLLETQNELAQLTLKKESSPELQKKLVINLLDVLIDENMQKVIQGNSSQVLEIINVYSQGKLPKNLIEVVSSLIKNNITNTGLVLTSLKNALEEDSTPLITAITAYEKANAVFKESGDSALKNDVKTKQNILLVEGLKFIHSDNMRKVISVNKAALETLIRGTITSLTGAKEDDVKQSVAYILKIYDNKELFNQVINTVESVVCKDEVFTLSNIGTAFTAFDSDSISPLLRVFNAKQPFAEKVATAVFNISNETEKSILIKILETVQQNNKVMCGNDVFVDALTTVLKEKVAKDPPEVIRLKDVEQVFENCKSYIDTMATAVCKSNTNLDRESVAKDISEALFKNKSLLLQVAIQKEPVLNNLVLDRNCKVVTFFSASAFEKISNFFTSSAMSFGDVNKSKVDPNALENILTTHLAEYTKQQGPIR